MLQHNISESDDGVSTWVEWTVCACACVCVALVWFGSHRREWKASTNLGSYLARKLQFLSLFLHLIFFNEPEQKHRETSAIRSLRMSILRRVGRWQITPRLGPLRGVVHSPTDRRNSLPYNNNNNNNDNNDKNNNVCSRLPQHFWLRLDAVAVIPCLVQC